MSKIVNIEVSYIQATQLVGYLSEGASVSDIRSLSSSESSRVHLAGWLAFEVMENMASLFHYKWSCKKHT